MARSQRAVSSVLIAAALLIVGARPGVAQPPQDPRAGLPVLSVASAAERSPDAVTLTFANRPIVVFRARVLGRQPSDRAAGATRILDNLIEQGIAGPVAMRDFAEGSFVMVGGHGVFALTQADVDELGGETLDGVKVQTITQLRQALADASEARSPRLLIRHVGVSLIALLFATLLLRLLIHTHRWLSSRIVEAAERRFVNAGVAGVEELRASRLLDVERGAIGTLSVAVGLVIVYSTLTFILRRFPYTRPWGESMSGLLFRTATDLGAGILRSLPGLLTVVLIVLLTRVAVRVIAVWFNAVEHGRVRPWLVHPETAQPTRRLVTALLWLFAIVVAYPYLPGSGTEAFKGVSVFLGLMVTLGSSGIVNQVMSGFTLTYSRALRLNDFVKIGDVEGTVTYVGMLSTKIRTLKREEVTIPNAVVVGQTATNYSRLHEEQGVMTPTAVTIGYDAPWRQVQALLLGAAARTPGIRTDPKPVVLQSGLEDFYVRYTLWVALERQEARPFTLHALHANIQDLFNEYGVQIMSPNYVLDPARPKVVPRADWYAAPASPEIEAAEHAPPDTEPV